MRWNFRHADGKNDQASNQQNQSLIELKTLRVSACLKPIETIRSRRLLIPFSEGFIENFGSGKICLQLCVVNGELRSVDEVESIREIAGKVITARRYCLSSLALNIELFARAARGHRGMENSYHWVLDVVMREDESRTRTGHAAENLATLRQIVLNLSNRNKTKKREIKGKQLNTSWDHAYFLRLLDF